MDPLYVNVFIEAASTMHTLVGMKTFQTNRAHWTPRTYFQGLLLDVITGEHT